MTVPRMLRATVRSEPMASEQRTQQRSITAPNGQSQHQVDSHIGRSRAGRPYIGIQEVTGLPGRPWYRSGGCSKPAG
jgi:hypothetical protein